MNEKYQGMTLTEMAAKLLFLERQLNDLKVLQAKREKALTEAIKKVK